MSNLGGTATSTGAPLTLLAATDSTISAAPSTRFLAPPAPQTHFPAEASNARTSSLAAPQRRFRATAPDSRSLPRQPPIAAARSRFKGNWHRLCPSLGRKVPCTNSRCEYVHSCGQIKIYTYPGGVVRNYKTKNCRFQRKGLWCPYGAACIYAHTSEEKRDSPITYKRDIPCPLHSITGECYFFLPESGGEECPYMHYPT